MQPAARGQGKVKRLMSNSTNDDPATVIVPFGKYKGVAAADLPAIDPRYAQWLLAQGWVAQQFAAIHAAIAARGATNDDSPEHNALQVRFLDPGFRLACLQLALGKGFDESRERDRKIYIEYAEAEVSSRKRDLGRTFSNDSVAKRQSALEAAEAALITVKNNDYQCRTRAVFECGGVDVVLHWVHTLFGAEPVGWMVYVEEKSQISIELKPSMGDDFPTVMRQMRRLKCAYLVVGTYNGTTVSEDQLRQMFEANGQKIIFVREIEAQMGEKNLGFKFEKP